MLVGINSATATASPMPSAAHYVMGHLVYTAVASGNATKAFAYLGSADGVEFKIGLFDSSGNLIAESSVGQTAEAMGWVEVDFPSTAITASTEYKLGVFPAGYMDFGHDGGTWDCYAAAFTYPTVPTAITTSDSHNMGLPAIYLEASAAATPTISSVTPSTVTPSSNPVITGTNFQGTGVVTISPTDDVDDVNAEVQTIAGSGWGDTEITLDGVTFPTGTAHNDTLYLFVTNDTGETNASGYALTASVAPSLSNDGVIDATTDGFKLSWDTDTDNGTSVWALFATAENRNAWTVSGLPGELTEPANSVDWGTQAVTALGTQETALITGLGEGQTLYYRIYHYGDVTANGS